MKRYLGDSVYAKTDDYEAIILTIEDGVSVSNVIYLGPEVIKALEQFIDEAREVKEIRT